MADLEKGRISMTDEAAFTLGENIATTEGEVVYENELFQLIQYKPLTEKVSNRPLIIVPPFINKFYILDLQPENSFVRYCLEQGNSVFIISWANPDADKSELHWDDYIENGLLKAVEVTKKNHPVKATQCCRLVCGWDIAGDHVGCSACAQRQIHRIRNLLYDASGFFGAWRTRCFYRCRAGRRTTGSG